MSNRTHVYTCRIPMRWGDMDAFGHVNNTVYFRYMEQARVEWLEQFGGMSDPGGEGPVVVNANCTFLRQLTYPGDIEVRVYVGDFGRSSIDTWYELRRTDAPEVICAEGGAKVVWINFAQQKSVALSDAWREKLARPAR